MEYKAISGKPDQIEGRTVTGLAAVFGNVDSGGDRLHEGAFRKTIKENARRIRHLWQHDMASPPIASIDEIREVGRSQIPAWVKDEYPEVTGGLLVKRTYLETPRGNEVLEGIRAGAINEMSFGYDAVKFDYELQPESKATVRNLREVKLFDTSDVVWGMNRLTLAAKAEGEGSLKSLYRVYSEGEAEAKAAALLLQNAAGELLCNPGAFGDEVAKAIKGLMDLLTAEPPTAEAVRALTDEINLRLEFARRYITFEGV